MKDISPQNPEPIVGVPSHLEVPESLNGWSSWMKIAKISDSENEVVCSSHPLQDGEAVLGSLCIETIQPKMKPLALI